jgi:hypothetical protein
MGTNTTNYNFYKPAEDETGWADAVNDSFDDLDSLLAAHFVVTQSSGSLVNEHIVARPVTGPASSTDHAVTRWDGASGDTVQNSGVIVDDSNNVTGINTLTMGAGTKCDGFVTRPAAEVQTSGSAQTTLDYITLLDENTYHMKAYVIGVESSGSQRGSYDLAATAYRTGGGGATLQGTPTVLHAAESDANWDATLTVNGNDARVSVTGVNATTIEWGGILSYMNMSN